MKLRIGSRKSALALWQTQHVANLITQAHPGCEIEIVTMETLGDKRGDVPLPSIGVKGLFTFELEEQLLADTIDLAVHSLKDLPGTLPDGLTYAGSPERANPTDAFISTRWNDLSQLSPGSVIATGSTRRKAQLLAQFPFLEFVDLRGNIDTRLRKLNENGWDGIIMASAALERMQRPELISMELPPDSFIPAVGQGAIGIETREGREDIDALLKPILHDETVLAVRAERIFLKALEGGCSAALGAYCYQDDGHWHFLAWVSSPQGTQVMKEHKKGSDPHALATDVAQQFINNGARRILST